MANNPLILKLAQATSLDADDRARLSQLTARPRHVPAKEDIVCDGEPPNDVQVVMEGFACRYKLLPGGRRSITAFLMPGDICNVDAAILDRMDHAIGTLTSCAVVDISRTAIDALTRSHPNIAHALRWSTLVDEATLREWLANMGQRTSDHQMAHLLCELRRRLLAVGLAEPHALRLPVTQEELADALGISTVHVNRVLQQLRDADLVRVQGRLFTFPDPVKLEQFAEFDPDYLHQKPKALAGKPFSV